MSTEDSLRTYKSQTNMTIAEALKALRGPGRVYANVRVTDDDSMYVQAVKADVIWRFERMIAAGESPDAVVCIRRGVDGSDFYID